MEKSINYTTVGYADQYFNLTQQAIAKILEIVRAKQGRITLFTMEDAWDEDASAVKEEVRDNSVELIMNNDGKKINAYPIDFFDNNGYVNILFVDDYGDYPRMYSDQMDEMTAYKIADFLVQLFGQDILKYTGMPTDRRSAF